MAIQELAEAKKLLDWCNENYNYETQKWNMDNVPNEILDCVLVYMKAGYPDFEDEWNTDFVTDFIHALTQSKIWKITRQWMKESVEEELEGLFWITE